MQKNDTPKNQRNITMFVLSSYAVLLRKISKIGAARCHILRLKCIKFDFRWGLRPRPRWGAYISVPQIPYLYLRGLLLRGGRGKGSGAEGGTEGKEEGRGEEGEGEGKVGKEGGTREKCED